jgi:16S rRNA (cytosine1402-N4)-methyltransferase
MNRRDVRHVPVLLGPVLEVIAPRPGMIVVDCTVGLGGHSAELLQRILPGGRLIGIDFDQANLDRARRRLGAMASEGQGFELLHGNFAGIQKLLAQAGVSQVDAVLADLGVASPQIDDPVRGFSYRQDGPLDMRMDVSRGTPAAVLLNQLSQREIEQMLLELGDETDAPAIAALIVQRRKEHPIQRTRELMEIVCQARDFTIERAAGAKLHPAARTFQALRILTNRELGNLENLLRVLPEILRPGGASASDAPLAQGRPDGGADGGGAGRGGAGGSGGVACIISFHSGEDRRVKDAFRSGLRGGIYRQVSEEPVMAEEPEQRENPRSRSAKLRWARRV